MQRNRQQGFTLLELLVVIGIMVMAITVAAVNFRGSGEAANIKKFGLEVISLMRYSRDTAVAKSQLVELRLQPEERQLVLLPAQRTLDWPQNVELSLGTIGAPNSRHTDGIYFYPDGTSNGATLDLHANGEYLQITVSWLTGEVRLGDQ